LAASLFAQGKTVFDRLEEIHQQFGYHTDELINQTYKGKEGADRITKIMTQLRERPPINVGDAKVTSIYDYQTSRLTWMSQKPGEDITLPKSNVLAFTLEDGSRITARPSGTEPKIKFYFNLTGTNPKSLEHKKKQYIHDFTTYIDNI